MSNVLLLDVEDARLALLSPERRRERAKSCFFRHLLHVKSFPVLSFPRSLDWPDSRATRWRPWKGWNTHCPTYRVRTSAAAAETETGEKCKGKRRGKHNSLFITAAISGLRGETHMRSRALFPQNISLQHIVRYWFDLFMVWFILFL